MRAKAGSQTACAKALVLHRGVHDAAAVRNSAGELVASVVPDDRYMDEVLGQAGAQAAVLNKWQKTYELSQSSKAALAAPSAFNTVGWDSSYTRQPLPVDHMQEWVHTSVENILELRPKLLYEIGCGSGLLLMRIAPHCERYVAVDFSREVVSRVKEQLQTVPALAARVELMERHADNVDGLNAGSFDTVVINSAAQYFPSSGYLTRVLESAVRLVSPGGQVFVGDVRNLSLLTCFAASVELFQAHDDADLEAVRIRVQKRLRHTPELVLSPAFFLALRQRIPGISRIEIRPRDGRADNEMTRYRYDAILHVGNAEEPTLAVPFEDWLSHCHTRPQIASLLQERRRPFGISRIPNARVERDIAASEILSREDPSATVAALKREVNEMPLRGIHPEDLSDLCAQAGFRLRLSWAACRGDGSYDACFLPVNGTADARGAAILWPEPEPSSFVRVANAPGQNRVRRDLVQSLLVHCRENLPEGDLPSRVMLVDIIPSTADAAEACAEMRAFESE